MKYPQVQSHPVNMSGEGEPRSIKVLMYHRIVEDESLCHRSWLCIHVKQFRRQMDLLERWGFTPITFLDYRLFNTGALNLPKKPIILTFDDGYRDTYEMAFPTLREFGMKAVVFVLGDRSITTNCWDRALGLPEAPLMTDTQMLEMYAAGFEIGAHSMTHTRLTQLSDEQAWYEIVRPKSEISRLLEAPVESFCYPYELVDDRIKTMVMKAGYTFACSVGSGPATFGEDPYEIRRLAIHTGVGDFGLKVLLPYHYYQWGRRKIRRFLKRSPEAPIPLPEYAPSRNGHGRVMPSHASEQAGASGVDAGAETASMSLKIDVVNTVEDFAALKDEWNAIVEASSATIFQTFDWNFLWWKHFGGPANRTLHILVFRHEKAIVGIAPFFLETTVLAGIRLYRRLKLIGSPVSVGMAAQYDPSDYLDIIGMPLFQAEMASALAVYIQRDDATYDEVILENIADDSFVLKGFVPRMSLRKLPHTITRDVQCPRLRLPDSLDTILDDRGPNVRRRLSRPRKAFLNNRTCAVQTLRSADEVTHGFQELITLHQNRWNRQGYPGLFHDPLFRQFQAEVVQRFRENGWLWFKTIRLHGTPIAARLGFDFHNCLYDYLSGFDEQAPEAKQKPGLALLLAMIEDGIRAGYDRVDFLRGDEPYKFDLTSEVHYNRTVRMVHPTAQQTLRFRVCRLLNGCGSVARAVLKEWRLLQVSRRTYGFPRCSLEYGRFRMGRLVQKLRTLAQHYGPVCQRQFNRLSDRITQRMKARIAAMHAPLLPWILRSLERDRDLPLSWKIRKGMVFLQSLLVARPYLWACQKVGKRARTRGYPYIRNMGRILIGDDFHLNSRIVRSELATGHNGKIEIGNEVVINFGVSICAQTYIRIGDRTRIGPYVTIMDSDFHTSDERNAIFDGVPTIIEEDVWLAGRVTVLKGTKIGKGAVITAGSVVSGVIPPGMIAGGVPARLIRPVKPEVSPRNDRPPYDRTTPDESIIHRVHEVFRKTFSLNKTIDASWGPDDITAWDSLGHLNLTIGIEEAFDITLSAQDMTQMNTVLDICDMLSWRLENRPVDQRGIEQDEGGIMERHGNAQTNDSMSYAGKQP